MRTGYFAAPLRIGLRSNTALVNFSIYGVGWKRLQGIGKAFERGWLTTPPTAVTEMTKIGIARMPMGIFVMNDNSAKKEFNKEGRL
jgi:hypothetical protein